MLLTIVCGWLVLGLLAFCIAWYTDDIGKNRLTYKENWNLLDVFAFMLFGAISLIIVLLVILKNTEIPNRKK